MMTPQVISPDITNDTTQMIDKIKLDKSSKSQLKKVSQEFESVFVSQMLTLMDKTVDKESGIFGDESKYMDNFKSFMFNEMGRQIAKNPETSFGFAKQMYAQMEKLLPPERTGAESEESLSKTVNKQNQHKSINIEI